MRFDEPEGHEKAPRHTDEQDQPEPERLVTPQEEEGVELQEMSRPPQAEGDRETVDDDGGSARESVDEEGPERQR